MCGANVVVVKALMSKPELGALCHFALFDLQPEFSLDLQDLALRYRDLARAVHPDRFVDANEREQRLVLQKAAQLNEAYQVLKQPSKRARYLLGLSGSELPLEVTVQDADFLLQQMHWREELEMLESDIAGVTAFKARLHAAQEQLQQEFSLIWHNPAARIQAEKLTRRMQFLDKLNAQVLLLEERLDD